MKKTSASFITLFFLLIFTFACDKVRFTPTGTNQQTVAKPPSLGNMLIGSPKDTLLIWGEVIFSYQYQSSYPILKAKFYFNNKLIYTGKYKGHFYFNSTKYSNTLHHFKIELYLKTGSGSLADRLNKEYYLVEDQMPFYIDNRKPYRMQIDSIQLEQGTVRLHWRPCLFYNFEKYEIYVGKNLKATIQNKRITTYDYKDYIGGGKEIKFRIDLFARGNSETGYVSYYSHSYKPAIRAITFDAENKVHITWNRCPFYANLLYYKLYRRIWYENKVTEEHVTTLNSADDTTYVDQPIHFESGHTYYYKVIAAGRAYNLTSNAFKVIPQSENQPAVTNSIPYEQIERKRTQKNSLGNSSFQEKQKFNHINRTRIVRIIKINDLEKDSLNIINKNVLSKFSNKIHSTYNVRHLK